MCHFLCCVLSLQCLANVQEAFAAVEAALMGNNAGKVAKDFGCCQIPKNLEEKVTGVFFFFFYDGLDGYKG